MSEFDRSYTKSYQSAIVIIALSCVMFNFLFVMYCCISYDTQIT